MPIFVILVVISAGLLWLLLSFAFIPFGRFVSRLWKDARDAMSEEDKDEFQETEEKE